MSDPVMPLNVVHVSSEVSPFSQTGGLGVVAGALPAALRAAGVAASVITPCYREVPRHLYEDTGLEVEVSVGARRSMVQIMRGELDGGVPVYLLKCDEAFDREGIYGPRPSADFADNAWRFGLLCEGALAASRRLRLHPDIFHCHDWQTGLLPLLCHERISGWVRTLMTVHNLGYHGTFPADTMEELGLDRGLFHPDGVEFWGWLSFLKAGLVYADQLTTVSPTYAQEITTPRYGHGLDGVMRKRQKHLTGILNGIDSDQRLPSDPRLAAPFSASDLSGKAACRRHVIDTWNLVDDDTPVIAVVSRLVSQKGVDLIEEATARLTEAGRVRLAILGTGDRELEQTLMAVAQRWPGRVAVQIRYDDDMAHALLAGADAVLIPSRYEPCGLTQMFGLRYGTLPVVRNTGGLADTVSDQETGFTFDAPTAEALESALERLLTMWTDRPHWEAMIAAAMSQDHSWTTSAARYKQLYEEVQHAE